MSAGFNGTGQGQWIASWIKKRCKWVQQDCISPFLCSVTPESVNLHALSLSLSLTLVPLVFLTLVSIIVFTAGSPPRPANWLNSRRRMELGRGETPQGHRTHTHTHTHTLVLFLGLLVAVTWTRFLHLCDSYEAADSYGGCGENKRKSGVSEDDLGKEQMPSEEEEAAALLTYRWWGRW